jgi:tetratricopeptide (TPR) repeat protein
VRTADHFHASVTAHVAGVAEPDIGKKHEWNLRAIAQADQVADRSLVNHLYASNLNNLGMSYAHLGDQRKAIERFEAALRAVDDVQRGPHREQVRAGIEGNLAKARHGV